MEEHAGRLVDHVSQRLGEMRSGIIEDMVDDIGSAKWSTESPYFIATIEFRRRVVCTIQNPLPY
jgi:hypothetical protein